MSMSDAHSSIAMADLDKVRSKVANNYRTGKVKANRKKQTETK
jgi:hypothetical protein